MRPAIATSVRWIRRAGWAGGLLALLLQVPIAAYADRIVFLKDGTIVDETRLDGKGGDHSQLVADKVRAMGD